MGAPSWTGRKSIDVGLGGLLRALDDREGRAVEGFADLAPKLAAKGYRPLPLTATKQPAAGTKRWNAYASRSVEPERMDEWRRRYPRNQTAIVLPFEPGSYGVGLALDVDVDDPELAAKVEEIAHRTLPPSPLERRRVDEETGEETPRGMWLYRLAEPLPDDLGRVRWGPKGHDGIDLKGPRLTIPTGETSRRPTGHQVAVFGRADSGRIVWPEGCSPLDLGPESWPLVTPAELRSFLREVAPVLGFRFDESEHGAEVPTKLPPSRATPPPSAPAVPVSDYILRRRFERFARKAPPSVSGKGGRSKLNRVAEAGVIGFELPPGTVAEIVADVFSPRCSPPWSPEEITEAIEAAPRWTTNPRGYLRRRDPEIDALVAHRLAAVAALDPKRWKRGPKAALRNLLRVSASVGTVDFNASVEVVARGSGLASRTMKRHLRTIVEDPEAATIVARIRGPVGDEATRWTLGKTTSTEPPREGGSKVSGTSRPPREPEGGGVFPPLRPPREPKDKGQYASGAKTAGKLGNPLQALDNSPLWRRSVRGVRGLGPGPLRLLGLILVESRSLAEIARTEGEGLRSLERWAAALVAAGLARKVGEKRGARWETTSTDLRVIRLRIDEEARERGLIEAEDREERAAMERREAFHRARRAAEEPVRTLLADGEARTVREVADGIEVDWEATKAACEALRSRGLLRVVEVGKANDGRRLYGFRRTGG